jgi:Lamin Tail Domain/Secretion system C-terminal sorting domain
MRLSYVSFLLLFAFASNAQSITISEINFKSALSFDTKDWVELHNFGATTIDLSNWKLVDTAIASVAYNIPVGTSIAPSARLVICKNLGTFTAAYNAIGVTVTNKIGNFGFTIGSEDRLLLKNAANATIVTADINDSYTWQKGGAGGGRTNELVNQSQNTSLTSGADWRSSCMFGSPGAAPSTCVDPIIITEINYNSNDTFDQGEFLELFNNTNSPIDLTGYYLRDGSDTLLASGINKYDFPAGKILPAGGYLVISNDTNKAKAYHSNLNSSNLLGNFNFNLANQGEMIRLFDPNFRIKFSIQYNDTIPWPLLPDGSGFTLELIQKNGLYNDGSNWESGCKLGSPGGPKTSPCLPVYPLSVQNDFLKSAVRIYPNPSSGLLHIIADGQELESILITDISGKTALTQKAVSAAIDISSITPGLYWVTVFNKQQQKITLKVIIE